MKKKFKMNNLECANCAAKMQEEISKLDGVNSVNVNFMFQKLTLDDEKFDDILKKANDICKSIESNASIDI
ncbi:MAG: cation transporter [Peptostreptococcaceae bacterium]|nr:cation transporter [Peptostreptococcaceae bacterium]